MPFREKLRKTFSRGSQSSTSGSSSEESSQYGGDDLNSNWIPYKPGERIPYKYRRPVDKAHKEKLDSFTFATAWNARRKSFTSQYSPMGSRLPSRRCSMEIHTPRRSVHLRRGDTGELAENSDEESTPTNVGLSRRNSKHERPFSNTDSQGFLNVPGASSRPRSRHDTPFSPEDLTLALQRSRLS